MKLQEVCNAFVMCSMLASFWFKLLLCIRCPHWSPAYIAFFVRVSEVMYTSCRNYQNYMTELSSLMFGLRVSYVTVLHNL
jgi:hypothetical protein